MGDVYVADESNHRIQKFPPASSNADLSNLTANPGNLTPPFSASTTTYAFSVSNSVTSTNLKPTLADALATMTINGEPATNGDLVSIPLNVGSNVVNIVVRAQDGTTIKTYTVTINRNKSTNADLSLLTISPGLLTPAFLASTTSYTASFFNTTSSVNIKPTLADTSAIITVNGNPATNNSIISIPLNVGTNAVSIMVTAQNGVTTKHIHLR